MPLHVSISSEYFDDGSQDVIVRDNLLVVDLIREIMKEYKLDSADYVIRPSDSTRVLNGDLSLEAQGIVAGSAIVFEAANAVGRTASALAGDPVGMQKWRIALKSGTGVLFPITDVPAFIGRPPKGADGEPIAVDLTNVDPARSTSRPHGLLRQIGSEYHIESIRDDNPVYVNGVEVAIGSPVAVRHGDQLRFGSVTLFFLIAETQES
jgi:hypothetical protein